MRKALEKTRAQQQKKKASQTDATPVEAGTDAKMQKCLVGRTNLGKAVNCTDPKILQGFKEIFSKKEVKVVKNPQSELCNGFSDATRPYLLHKGRNIQKYLVKDDDVRAVLERTVDQFRVKLLAGETTKSVKLWLCLARLIGH